MSFIGGYPGPAFRTAYTSALGGSAPPVNVDRIYLFHNDSGSQHWSEIATTIAAGRTPIISIKGASLTWAQMASGSADSQLDTRIPAALALDISGLPFPPRIAFHHEPEGDGTVADFNAMQIHLVNRYKAAIRAAGWDLCFISTGGVYAGDNGSWTAANWLTAITGVDITRCYADVYEKPGGTAPYSSPSATWRNPATNLSSRFRIYLDWCVAHGYTPACPEFGINQWQDDPAGTKQGQWLQSCANFSRSQECEFFLYYDRVVGEGGATSNTAITHGGVLTTPSTAALTAFSHLYVAPSNIYNVNLIANSDVDQTASLLAQIAAVPNGTAGSPNIIRLPAGRFRIDGSITLNVRSHLRLTCVSGVSVYPNLPTTSQAFIAYTDVKSDLAVKSNRTHFSISGSNDVVCSFLRIEGPNNEDVADKPGFAKYWENREGEHAFRITSNANIPCVDCGFEDCSYVNVYGDGFYLGGGNSQGAVDNASIRSHFHRGIGTRSGRHGCSIVNGNGVDWVDMDMRYSGRGGFDIEPNGSKQYAADVNIIRMTVLPNSIGFEFTGSQSNTEIPWKKRNIYMKDCVDLSNAGLLASHAPNSGYFIMDNMQHTTYSGTAGATIAGWDEVIVMNSRITTSRNTPTSVALVLSMNTPGVGTVTITNNNFNGRTDVLPSQQEGFDQLYSIVGNAPASIVHYGNVWAMGTLHDGTEPLPGVTASIAQVFPPLQQAAFAGPVIEVEAVVVQTLPRVTQQADARFGGYANLEVGFTGIFAETPFAQFQLANVGESVEAVIAQTLPALTQALQADAVVEAVVAQTLPVLTQLALGYHGFTAEIHQTLPALRQAETGGAVSGAVTQTFPALVQTVTVIVDTGGRINQTLPSLTQSATVELGELEIVIVQVLPALVQSASGHVQNAPSWDEWPVAENDEWLVGV